jgi:integrase
VGHSRSRSGKDGKRRYTAYYEDIRGHRHSAGTFATKRDADKAWQQAEARVAEGRINDPRRGRQTFRHYVEKTWLPNHVIEPTTRESYTYSIHKHLLPWFGDFKMAEILPAHVREWIVDRQAARVSPATIRYNKILLGSIFTTALNDLVVFLHPCRGVRTPTVAVKPRRIITPEQFDQVYLALHSADAQLLVELDIESGLRWGELSELRVDDLHMTSRILTVSRAVVEVNSTFHPDGKRFLVKQYPKDKEFRRFKLSVQIIEKLKAHIRENGLGPNDLLFAMRQADAPKKRVHVVRDPSELGMTEPNEKGRQYRHGTTSAYSAGRCRCQDCKTAYAVYRAARRAGGKDSPRKPRQLDTDGHFPRDWFRRQVWYPAVTAAGIEIKVRVHDLRHAHASWLLAGGADLQVVKERLGHASITTTEKYLHTLPDADETALDALAKIRRAG